MSPNFRGKFLLNTPLSEAHRAYLLLFAETRRMQRDATKTALRPDPVREAVNLPVGNEGCYFVGGSGSYGQEHQAPDVTDYNSPPQEQPGLWCQWVPSEDGTAIEWDESEKFHHWTSWLRYLIYHFLAPWGYVLNGKVCWYDHDEGGAVEVRNNEVFDLPEVATL